MKKIIPDLKSIKARMRAIRLSREDMTIAKIAEITDLSPTTIRRYDDPSSESEPSLYSVVQVCHHFGVSIDYMVFGARFESNADGEFQHLMQSLFSNMTSEQKQGLIYGMKALLQAGANVQDTMPGLKKFEVQRPGVGA